MTEPEVLRVFRTFTAASEEFRLESERHDGEQLEREQGGEG
jgi:hypothetical protein